MGTVICHVSPHPPKYGADSDEWVSLSLSQYHGQLVTGFIYGPQEGVYPSHLKTPPRYALPAPLYQGHQSPSCPWCDLHIIRHFSSDFWSLKLHQISNFSWEPLDSTERTYSIPPDSLQRSPRPFSWWLAAPSLHKFWLILITFWTVASLCRHVTQHTGNCNCRRVHSHCWHDATRPRCRQICSHSSRLLPTSCEFHTHRRRDLIRQPSRVGISGVYSALLTGCPSCHWTNSVEF